MMRMSSSALLAVITMDCMMGKANMKLIHEITKTKMPTARSEPSPGRLERIAR